VPLKSSGAAARSDLCSFLWNEIYLTSSLIIMS